MKIFKMIMIAIVALVISGCSMASIVATDKPLPSLYKKDDNGTVQKVNVKVSLFRLNNYTDTPRAGMRAASILEGMLVTKGYKVKSHITSKSVSLKKARKIAKSDGSKYFMYGGVSEWRYKTGIDGEPAVSLQCSLYKTKNTKLVWSATGSDSDWGNASIGTTAQDLLAEMILND
jgi:hypothetical protein